MLLYPLKKTLALALATITFGLPIFTNEAFAATHNSRPSQEKEIQLNKHVTQHNSHRPSIEHKVDYKKPNETVRHNSSKHASHKHVHPQPTRDHHHNSTGTLIGGLVIGAILGTIIANNNADA